jgi:hypothetical protein
MKRSDIISLDEFLDWATGDKKVELFDSYGKASELLGTGCSLEVVTLDDDHLETQLKKIGGFSEIYSAEILNSSGEIACYLVKVTPSIDQKWLQEIGKGRQPIDSSKMYTHEVAYGFR